MNISRAELSLPPEYSPMSIFIKRLASSMAIRHSPSCSARNLTSASIVVLVSVSSVFSKRPFFFWASSAYLKALVFPAPKGHTRRVRAGRARSASAKGAPPPESEATIQHPLRLSFQPVSFSPSHAQTLALVIALAMRAVMKCCMYSGDVCGEGGHA